MVGYKIKPTQKILKLQKNFSKTIDISLRKVYNIFNEVSSVKRPNFLNEIKQKILNTESGTVFVAVDFVDITDKTTVSVCLTRLENENIIQRILRGVYYKAEYNEFLQEYVVPNPDKVAHALARNFGWTIVPCGDTALNILGLSTQVSAAWSYVSDGTYKEYTYDNTTIKFKRTTNKEISRLSYKTALVIQALKALGKDNIDDTIIIKLKNDLTDEEKTTTLLEAKAATSWIYEYIKQICKS